MTDERFAEISEIVHRLMGQERPSGAGAIMNTYEACAIGDLLKYAERLRRASPETP